MGRTLSNTMVNLGIQSSCDEAMYQVSLKGQINKGFDNRESPAQFQNRTKPWVYVRRITRGTTTMYEKAPFVSWNWRKEN